MAQTKAKDAEPNSELAQGGRRSKRAEALEERDKMFGYRKVPSKNPADAQSGLARDSKAGN